MFDFFRFNKDFVFQNDKHNIIVIPEDEYQTKDFKCALYQLKINDNNEVEEPLFSTEFHPEFPKGDPRRWKSEIISYKKINFSGKFCIYSNTKTFNLNIEDGKIYHIS